MAGLPAGRLSYNDPVSGGYGDLIDLHAGAEASGFVGILAIVGVTGGMGNWNVYEVCILFSMCAVIEAIGQAFFDNVWGMDHMMRRGELDVFLTRPAPVFLAGAGTGHPLSGGFIPDHICGDLCVGGSAA